MAEHALETTITNPDLAGENVLDSARPDAAERELPEPRPADKHGWWWGVGRRKAAVARVRLRPAADGEGKGSLRFQITRKQYKSLEEYFSSPQERLDALAALDVTGANGKLDVVVRCAGGGPTGQSQAVRLGIARALVGYDPTYEPVLRDVGFLPRDARRVERKKYGQPGARRRFQFSKR